MIKINPRIAAAFVFGLLMVAGSFWLSLGKEPTSPESITALDTEANGQPIRGYIPVNDNDADGLPDWQNTFNISTVYVDNTPTETLTTTGAMAIVLATQLAGGNKDTDAILNDPNLRDIIADTFVDQDYTINDIKVSEDNSVAALRIYGNQVASIAFVNAPPQTTEDELTVFNRALSRNDPEILTGLDPTITSYEKMLADMLEVQVPSSLTREHLALTNVYQAILIDIKAFRDVFNDALPATTRFRRYLADVAALNEALVLLYAKLHNSGVQWSSQDTASRLIKTE